MGDTETIEVASPPRVFPKRPKRTLKINAEAVTRSVKNRVEDILNDRDRSQWMDARLQRYAKYRGWLGDKTWPWANASNVHIPVLQIAELRANAGLHNVVMSTRPILTAKATKRSNIPKEEKITNLIDTQFFVDPGPEQTERNVSDFVSNFLQDSNAVAFTPWVRDERTVTTVHFRPPVPEGIDPDQYVAGILQRMFPSTDEITAEANVYTIRQRRPGDTPATVTVFQQEDGTLELVVKQETTIYDGPVWQVLPISAVLVPTRVTNLQPPSEFNPEGSPYVFVLLRYQISEIRRLKQSGHINWLDADGMDKIIDSARSAAGVQASAQKPEDQLESQKDTMEGREHGQPDVREEADIEHLTVDFVMCFDRWDVNGGGQIEQTFWMIARDAEVLCEARLLQERWPSLRPYRPLAESVAIPVPHRYYGISLLELGEALYDLIKGTFDISFDAGQVSNLPFFFYAAQSAFRAETITLSPGQGYPVPGDPQRTVHFPNLPTKDQRWAFNIIGLAFQMFERLMMIGDLQLGRVPTGKASALRTMGTTVALLQQGDVRADQLLLRLFGGLRQIARNFHLMNRHLLPEGKEIRVVGWDGPREQGYQTIESVDDINADMDFDFRPDFLLSNAAVLSQTMQSVMAVVISPLAVQFGITDQQLFYNLIKDYIRALRLDPKKYVKQPSRELGPAILATEAIDMITSGDRPVGVPLEGAEAHLKMLFEFRDSEQFGNLSPAQVQLWREWTEQVAAVAQQERDARAAQAFQASLAQGGGPSGAEGVPTTIQEPGIAEGEATPVESPTGDGAGNA